MKKSFIAASLLFSVSAFAGVCGYPALTLSSSSQFAGYNYDPSGNGKWRCFSNEKQALYTYGVDPTHPILAWYNKVSSCPSGSSPDSNGVCVPVTCTTGFDYSSATCIVPPLSYFDNNPSGCVSAGGYYFNDGKCVDGTDAIAKVFTDPTAIIGGLIFINGAAWSIAGAYALPITGGASGAAIAYGAHAMVAGLATLGVSALGQLYNQPDSVTPKTDSTTGETRIKVKLQSDNSTTVAQGDISSGKVDSVSYIPPEVKQRILDGVVNPTTGLPNITQSDLAGTTVTKYNYTNNTATTETIKSDGTTVTSSTPITPISNSDGSVTAQSHDESIAPTVTGSKHSSTNDPNWSAYSTIAQWTETISTNSGTGSTSGGGSTGTTPVSTGDPTADAIVNADMPAYSLGDTGSFDTLDKSVVNDMSTTTTGFLDNIQGQIDAAQTVYDQTSALISGGWDAPQIPLGECGSGMSMDFHGQHVDLCPPIANFLAPISPIVTLLVTIAGTAFSIAIFIGGF